MKKNQLTIVWVYIEIVTFFQNLFVSGLSRRVRGRCRRFLLNFARHHTAPVKSSRQFMESERALRMTSENFLRI